MELIATDTSVYRMHLATAITILERLGMIDFNGHFSARLYDGSIMINSGSSVRSAITPEDFVIVGANDEIDSSQPLPPAELPLHTSIYRSRHDVHAVVHCHPKWSTLLSAAGLKYRVIMPQGALLGDVPEFTSPRSISNRATAEDVAAVLGSGRAALLRAHGSVIAADDIVQATVLAIYLELNAERQVSASLLAEPRFFSSEEIDACRHSLFKPGLFKKCWDYYAAKFALAEWTNGGGRSANSMRAS